MNSLIQAVGFDRVSGLVGAMGGYALARSKLPGADARFARFPPR